MPYNSIRKEAHESLTRKEVETMKHLTITITGTTTTFTARNIFHAAHLVNEHFAATQQEATYFVHDRNMNLIGWFDTPCYGYTKWNALK